MWCRNHGWHQMSKDKIKMTIIIIIWLNNKQRSSVTYSLMLQSHSAERLRNILTRTHHIINTDTPKDREVEKGSGRHSPLQARNRSLSNQSQTNTSTALRAAVSRLLWDGTKHVWVFPTLSWAETGSRKFAILTLFHSTLGHGQLEFWFSSINNQGPKFLAVIK